MALSRRKLIAVLPAFLFASQIAIADASGPADAVKALYAVYQPDKDGIRGGLNARLASKVLSKSLFAVFLRAANSGNFDFDFFTQTNDLDDLKPVVITNVQQEGARASVSATIVEGDRDASGNAKLRTYKFVFKVVEEAGVWRIDDAAHEGRTVRQEWATMIRP